MDILLHLPDKGAKVDAESIRRFLQGMVDRLYQGELRYGKPHAGKRYLTRLELEIKAYRSGNREHLFNVANYCWLESICPENPRNTFNPVAPSATRPVIGD